MIGGYGLRPRPSALEPNRFAILLRTPIASAIGFLNEAAADRIGDDVLELGRTPVNLMAAKYSQR
jgi:hypothetical protein